MVAISQGRGRLETKSGGTTISAGMVFLLHPGTWHRYRPGSDLSVKEIAARLGCYSASHFSLEFKKARGKSPFLWSRQGAVKK